MAMFVFCYPVLAISIIYCIWSAHERAELRRNNRALRDRVTGLLCTMAKHNPEKGSVAEAGLCHGTEAVTNCTRTEDARSKETERWMKHSEHGAVWYGDTASSAFAPSEQPDDQGQLC